MLSMGSRRFFSSRNTKVSARPAWLGVSAAAVSQTIRNLENQLGLPLFQRTTRRVGITEAGKVLYDRVLPASKDVKDALEFAERLSLATDGTLEADGSPDRPTARYRTCPSAISALISRCLRRDRGRRRHRRDCIAWFRRRDSSWRKHRSRHGGGSSHTGRHMVGRGRSSLFRSAVEAPDSWRFDRARMHSLQIPDFWSDPPLGILERWEKPYCPGSRQNHNERQPVADLVRARRSWFDVFGGSGGG